MVIHLGSLDPNGSCVFDWILLTLLTKLSLTNYMIKYNSLGEAQ